MAKHYSIWDFFFSLRVLIRGSYSARIMRPEKQELVKRCSARLNELEAQCKTSSTEYLALKETKHTVLKRSFFKSIWEIGLMGTLYGSSMFAIVFLAAALTSILFIFTTSIAITPALIPIFFGLSVVLCVPLAIGLIGINYPKFSKLAHGNWISRDARIAFYKTCETYHIDKKNTATETAPLLPEKKTKSIASSSITHFSPNDAESNQSRFAQENRYTPPTL